MHLEPDQRRPESCLQARLHHLALRSEEPDALAQFYAGAMGYTVERQGEAVVLGASDRTLIIEPGPSKALAYAAFAVPDTAELGRLRARVEAAGISVRDFPSRVFADAITVSDPDGNEIVFGIEGSPISNGPGAAMPARLQHVVLASIDASRMAGFFENVLGFTVSDSVLDDSGGIRTVFLRCSHEHHSFAVFQASESRLDHHCYELPDWNSVRDWGDHFADNRIVVQWGPGRHGPGNNLFLFIHDLDGNWVELSAELEIVRHDRPAGTWLHEERTLNSWGKGLLRS
jgi:catechol-2,3-dioxygenase